MCITHLAGVNIRPVHLKPSASGNCQLLNLLTREIPQRSACHARRALKRQVIQMHLDLKKKNQE
jgi:hypothetical protein